MSLFWRFALLYIRLTTYYMAQSAPNLRMLFMILVGL
jgi:hypothetical protein